MSRNTTGNFKTTSNDRIIANIRGNNSEYQGNKDLYKELSHFFPKKNKIIK